MASGPQAAWATWTPEDVVQWLQDRGLAQYAEAFRVAEVDGHMLVEQLAFREDLLASMLGVQDAMHRAKIVAHAKHLRTGSQRQLAVQRASAPVRGPPPSASAMSATPASPITLTRFVDIVQGSAGGAESGDEDREVSLVPPSPLLQPRRAEPRRPGAHVARRPVRGGAKPLDCGAPTSRIEDRARARQAQKLARQENEDANGYHHPPLSRSSVTNMYGTWHETSKFSGVRYESSFGLDSVSYSRKGSFPGAGKPRSGQGVRQTMLGPASPDHANTPGPCMYKESCMDWETVMPKSARATIGLGNRRVLPLFHRSNERMERNRNSEPKAPEGDEAQHEWPSESLLYEDYEPQHEYEYVEKMT